MKRVKWGQDLVEKIYEEGTKNINEDFILDVFIHSNILKGTFEKSVKLGKTILYYDDTGRMSEREGRFIIDAICRNKDTVRVIEVETQLGMDHYSGIGQALVYAHVYKKENPDKTVIPTIVCVFADEDFLEVCKNCDIEVHYCEVGGIAGW